LYPDIAKVAKKFQHADKRNIPFAVIIGEDEIASDNLFFKNLVTGEQLSLDFEG
jgi:histidyl-tRNA synthetase